MTHRSICKNDDYKFGDNNIIVIIQSASDSTGVCIDRSELKSAKYPLTIPNLVDDKGKPLVFTEKSYYMLKRGRYSLFRSQPIKSGRMNTVYPITHENLKKFFRGELSESDFKNSNGSKLIGEGAYGKVMLDENTGIVTKKGLHGGVSEDVIKEIAIYSMLRSANCLPELFTWDIKKSMMSLQGGEVVSKRQLSPRTVRGFYLQLIECMRIANSQGVIHADIKPDNIIISKTDTGERLDVIDWGLAMVDRSKDQTHSHPRPVVTSIYRAPEVTLSDVNYDYKIDIFAMGVSMVDIITKDNLLWNDRLEDHTMYKYIMKVLGWERSLENTGKSLSGDLEDLYMIYEDNTVDYDIECRKALDLHLTPNFEIERRDDFIDLVSRMLNPNPKRRADYDEILSHPYFTGLKKQKPPVLKYVNEAIINSGILSTSLLGKRKMLFTWLLEVFKRYKIGIDVSFQALTMIDLYWSDNDIPNGRIQRMGCACAQLAIICSGGEGLFDWPYLANKCFTDDDLDDYMSQVINDLGGNVILSTAFNYYEHYNSIKKFDIGHALKDQTIRDLLTCLVYNPSYYSFPPDKVLENLDQMVKELPNNSSDFLNSKFLS